MNNNNDNDIRCNNNDDNDDKNYKKYISKIMELLGKYISHARTHATESSNCLCARSRSKAKDE